MRYLVLASEQLADETCRHREEAEHRERDESRHQQIDAARVVVVDHFLALGESDQHAEGIAVNMPVRHDALNVIDRIDIKATLIKSTTSACQVL